MKPSDSEKLSPIEDSLQVLLYEKSPMGNVDAIVQTEGKTVYFYLLPHDGNEYFAPKACWVRNLRPGPLVINQDDFLAGRPVALPRTHTRTNQPGTLPLPETLRVVWFEEGNGAALLENSRLADAQPDADAMSNKIQEIPSEIILAVIPPWSGQDGFHGYAADCAIDSPLCWPLPKNPRLRNRVAKADAFWKSFLRRPDPFIQLQDSLLDFYSGLFSKPGSAVKKFSESRADSQYYDIGGSKFPPRGLMEYRFADRTVLLTVGMSLCPQPNIELASSEAMAFKRIELGVELPGEVDPVVRQNARVEMGRLAGYPWRTFRWLGAGHTCQFPNVFSQTDVARIIEADISEEEVCQQSAEDSTDEKTHKSTGTSRRLSFQGEPIRLLWLVPKR